MSAAMWLCDRSLTLEIHHTLGRDSVVATYRPCSPIFILTLSVSCDENFLILFLIYHVQPVGVSRHIPLRLV